MHRIRTSLPYFKNFGWESEVVMIKPEYTDITTDELLLKSIPADIKIHKVKAFNKKWTSKIGLGSVALRSLWFYFRYVNQLLKSNRFDLIYFSTTQFPVCILGSYWKQRFKIPYVIDMQDPWHSDYYNSKPKSQQPSKYWFSYRLNKYLEPIAIKSADGLISVSEHYIKDLKTRYPIISSIPSAVITFGSIESDSIISTENSNKFTNILHPDSKNIVYIGRGGSDMHKALIPVFKAFKKGLIENPAVFTSIKLFFIGTSYAPPGKGSKTIAPLADDFGITDHVIEITDRLPYYHALATLQMADAVLITGSDDPKYTASKIYPYMVSGKPLLAVFGIKSVANTVLREYGAKYLYHFDGNEDVTDYIYDFLANAALGNLPTPNYNTEVLGKYDAKNMSRLQCELFEQVLSNQPL
ncbi:glycosyltransferase [Mucilaginibacter sp. SD-g]|uniref:Glycosyltransferase n=2 Tax=Mucilaginibacter segetis TaxID=2793071 RepID=A0A934PS42_9SPHI|nr:glycosyltransferase [Mucilaginibacter segetis]